MDAESDAANLTPADEPRPAVFFDLDRTIIPGSSMSQFGFAAWKAGLIDPRKVWSDLVRGLLFDWIGESESVADQMLPRILETLEGHPRSELLELRGPLVEQMLEQARPETLRLLGLHARMGRDCYIVSASAIEIVEMLADELGFTGAIATEAEVVDGTYTGRLAEPFRHGAEKARAIADLAAEKNYDLSLSFAYGDSHNDLPMLELVGIPIAVNPDTKLAGVAYERGWPVVQFAQPHHRAIRRLKVGAALGTFFLAGWLARHAARAALER
jgi:HAD superfamily hydrolase (TIGR01490 family)